MWKKLRKKFKKLQPGKLIKGVVNVAAAAGVPGAGAAQRVVERVGKRVESVERAVSRANAVAKEQGINLSIPTGQAAEQVLASPEPGAEIAIGSSQNGKNSIMLVAIAAVVLFFVMGKR